MADNYLRDGADLYLRASLGFGLALGVVGVVLVWLFAPTELEPGSLVGWLAGGVLVWAGTVLSGIGIVGYGVRLGREATRT